MLCQFLLYSKVNQLYVYIYSLFFRFPSHLSHHRALSSLCYTAGSHQLSVLFCFLTSLLEYNCFTMVCQFLLYNKVNQLYIHIYPHIPSLLRLPPSLPIPPLQVVTKRRSSHTFLFFSCSLFLSFSPGLTCSLFRFCPVLYGNYQKFWQGEKKLYAHTHTQCRLTAL